MDALDVLRIVRIFAFVLAAVLLLLIALRHHANFWQIGWVLIVVIHQIVFATWIAVVTIGQMPYDQRFSMTWSTCVDIHMAFAVIAYIAVLLIQERDNDIGRFVAANLPDRFANRDRANARKTDDERRGSSDGGANDR